MDLLVAAVRVSGADALPLFVYGTLMSGGEAAGRMEGAAYVGPADTAAEYGLTGVGDGDAGMLKGGRTAVPGELYLVGPGLLQELDEWEAGGGFARGEVSLSDGSSAQAYFLSG